jgi:hypothetical protein
VYRPTIIWPVSIVRLAARLVRVYPIATIASPEVVKGWEFNNTPLSDTQIFRSFIKRAKACAKLTCRISGVSDTGKESYNTLFIFAILGGLTLFMLVVYRPLLMYLAISDTKLKPYFK